MTNKCGVRIGNATASHVLATAFYVDLNVHHDKFADELRKSIEKAPKPPGTYMALAGAEVKTEQPEGFGVRVIIWCPYEDRISVDQLDEILLGVVQKLVGDIKGAREQKDLLDILA